MYVPVLGIPIVTRKAHSHEEFAILFSLPFACLGGGLSYYPPAGVLP